MISRLLQPFEHITGVELVVGILALVLDLTIVDPEDCGHTGLLAGLQSGAYQSFELSSMVEVHMRHMLSMGLIKERLFKRLSAIQHQEHRYLGVLAVNELHQVGRLFAVRAGIAHESHYMLALPQVYRWLRLKLVKQVQVDGFGIRIRCGTCVYVVDEEWRTEGCETKDKAYILLAFIRPYGVYIHQYHRHGYHGYVLPYSSEWFHGYVLAKAATITGVTLLGYHQNKVDNERDKYGYDGLVGKLFQEDMEQQEKAQQQLQPYHDTGHDTGYQYTAHAKVKKAPLEAVESVIVVDELPPFETYARLAVGGINKGSG